MSSTDLTLKQLKAVKLYISDVSEGGGNKTEAYRHAYNCENMKAATVNRKASELFDNPKIKVLIGEVHKKAVEQCEMTAAEVGRKLWLLANFNINKFAKVDDDGVMYHDFSNATDDDWYCIDTLTIKNAVNKGGGKHSVGEITIKPCNKITALKMAGECVGVDAFRPVVGVGNPDGTPFAPIQITRTVIDPDADES